MIFTKPAPHNIYVVGIVLLVIFIAERLSKWLALAFVPRGGWSLTGNALGFFIERNQGIAFSIPLPSFVLLIVVACIAIALGFFAIRGWKQGERPVFWGASLMFLGALSNAIDRIRFGYVIDFIRITPWPTFNGADILIVSGVSILLVFYLLTHTHYARPPHHSNDHRD